MSDAQARPRRVRLGNELRRLRELAGLTQRDIAAHLKVSQTTVDRIERGGPQGKPPPWPVVKAWAQLCADAGPDEALLRDLAEDARDEHALFRNMPPGGLAAVQEEVRAEEATSATIRNFNPGFIPGLLQTSAYARRILAIANDGHAIEADDAAEVRLRRQEILHEPGRRFEFIVTDWGLRLRPSTVQVQRAQLDQVASLAALPSVALSVIPAGAQALALPRSNFVLFEDRTDGGEPAVAVEIAHQCVPVTKPEDVSIYRAQYELLRQMAIHGDEAVAFVREVAESLA